MVDVDGLVHHALRHSAIFEHTDRVRAAVGLVWVDLNLPGGEWKKAILRTLPRRFAGDFPVATKPVVVYSTAVVHRVTDVRSSRAFNSRWHLAPRLRRPSN